MAAVVFARQGLKPCGEAKTHVWGAHWRPVHACLLPRPEVNRTSAGAYFVQQARAGRLELACANPVGAITSISLKKTPPGRVLILQAVPDRGRGPPPDLSSSLVVPFAC